MKRKISFTTLILLLISLFVVLGTGRMAPAKMPAKMLAKNNCSNASLRGSYGLHATGITATGDPFAAVGVFSFDGDGHLTATVFFRVPSGTSEVHPSGTYTVSPDCTVSDSWGGSQHESVIVDNGRGYVILNTSDNVISGEARKQFTEDSQ